MNFPYYRFLFYSLAWIELCTPKSFADIRSTNIVYEARSTPLLEIDSIDYRTGLTRLYVTLSYPKGSWLTIEQAFYLQPSATHQRIRCNDIEGADFNRKVIFTESGEIPVEIDFPISLSPRQSFNLFYEGKEAPCRLIGIQSATDQPRQKRKTFSFPLYGVSPDSTRLQGFIEGYHVELGMDSVWLYLEDPYFGKRNKIATKIQPSGYFSFQLPLLLPVQQTLYFSQGFLNCYLEPGSSLNITARAEEVNRPVRYPEEKEAQASHLKYEGKTAVVNRSLLDWRIQTDSIYRRYATRLSREKKDKTPLLEALQKEIYSVIAEKNGYYPASAKHIIDLDLQYRSACILLSSKLKEESDSSDFSFLKYLPLNDSLSVAATSYPLFTELLDAVVTKRLTQPSAEEFIHIFETQGNRLTSQEKAFIKFSLSLTSVADTGAFPDYQTQLQIFNSKYATIQEQLREVFRIAAWNQVWNKELSLPRGFTSDRLLMRRFIYLQENRKQPLTVPEYTAFKKNICNPIVFKKQLQKQKTLPLRSN